MVKQSHFSVSRGFTLLELSVVIMVLSIMLGGVLTVITQEVNRAKKTELKKRMEAIETALREFEIKNSRFPCPARAVLDMSNSNFGLEANNPGTCQAGAIQSDFVDVNTAGGAVPVRTLGLPDEYTFDPWEGKFSYMVTLSVTSAVSTYTYANDTTGSITVNDGDGNERTSATNRAIIALISHGSNGHGSFQRSGTRKDADSENANEQENCDCNNNGATTGFDSTIVLSEHSIDSGNADVQHVFDDIVHYYTRNQFLTADEKETD